MFYRSAVFQDVFVWPKITHRGCGALPDGTKSYILLYYYARDDQDEYVSDKERMVVAVTMRMTTAGQTGREEHGSQAMEMVE